MKITNDSHADHALTDAHLAFIMAKFGDKETFFLETVEMPPELPSLPCGLYGPIMGDPAVTENEVVYLVRGKREGRSRMIDRPMRQVRTMTAIGGPHEGETILYTAYGGPSAPREPWDTGLKTEAQYQESYDFWSKHALSTEMR